jgi:pimeloyl-ACP methyl ester carboxylesterase
VAEIRSHVRDGVRLAALERGAGDPPLLFVHGWCCDHGYFAPQIEHFARRHRVVALDQRGFGQSDRPPGEYAIETFADDAAWLCRELGLRRPVVVGHSLGGAVALALSARHPELPAAIALCDPAVFVAAAGDELRDELVEGLAGPEWRSVAEEFIREYLFLPSDDPELRERIVAGMCATPQRVMHSAFRSLVAFDDAAAAKACRVPVLVIEAGAPFVDRERLLTALPHAAIESTPGVGHFHQLEAPGRVNAILERFVSGLDAGPAQR